MQPWRRLDMTTTTETSCPGRWTRPAAQRSWPIETAKRAGTSQNKVFRVENGKDLLTAAEAATLLTVYGVHGDERCRIMTLVEAARAGHIDARVILQRGAHHFQERIRQLN